MAARLIESLATTDAFAELFSDASVLEAMLEFEAALARAQAHVGMVPRAAADAITAAAKPEGFDRFNWQRMGYAPERCPSRW